MKGYFDKQYHIQVQKVKLTGASAIDTAYDDVSFPEAFVNVPECWVVRPYGETGTWTATATTTGAVLTVANSIMTVGMEFFVVVISHEKL